MNFLKCISKILTPPFGMRSIAPIFILFLLFSCAGSKVTTLAKAGNTIPADFKELISFQYINKHPYVEVKINGSSYTFLFDTAYEITTLDKSLAGNTDFKAFKSFTTSGSSFAQQQIQYGYIPSLEIGNVAFKDIGIGFQDLSFVKSPFPNSKKIDGIIGTNVLRKAAWQIDYQNQVIRFSDNIEKLDIPKPISTLVMRPRNGTWGYNFVDVRIAGKVVPFIFDTGYSGLFTVPLQEAAMWAAELNTVQIEASKLKVQDLELGSLRYEQQVLEIEKDGKMLLGNAFLDRYLLTIDWESNSLYLSTNPENRP
jgi:predicted aspartyl protease